MILLDKSGDQYKLKEFFIVLSCILLSKSLYFETYANNLLLGVFLAFLAFTVKPSKLKINRKILFYLMKNTTKLNLKKSSLRMKLWRLARITSNNQSNLWTKGTQNNSLSSTKIMKTLWKTQARKINMIILSMSTKGRRSKLIKINWTNKFTGTLLFRCIVRCLRAYIVFDLICC